MAKDPMTAPAIAPELGEEPPESFDVVAVPTLEVVVVLLDELLDLLELLGESVVESKRLSGCAKDSE